MGLADVFAYFYSTNSQTTGSDVEFDVTGANQGGEITLTSLTNITVSKKAYYAITYGISSGQPSAIVYRLKSGSTTEIAGTRMNIPAGVRNIILGPSVIVLLDTTDTLTLSILPTITPGGVNTSSGNEGLSALIRLIKLVDF